MKYLVCEVKKLVLLLLDPRCYVHLLRLFHHTSYSHVQERAKVSFGRDTGIAPNVSFRNGQRIVVGSHCHIGEHCYLWAGDSTGEIKIGDMVSLAPGVFITASDYSCVKNVPFRKQNRHESHVRIGNDVWLGARVVVTAGVTIGDGCIVGAGAVVTRDLPDDSIAVGVPARVIGYRKSEN
jgi:acetyltransferase-like isoleucine patch superfamily enzyme